jgi:hypothetical protein
VHRSLRAVLQRQEGGSISLVREEPLVARSAELYQFGVITPQGLLDRGISRTAADQAEKRMTKDWTWKMKISEVVTVINQSV